MPTVGSVFIAGKVINCGHKEVDTLFLYISNKDIHVFEVTLTKIERSFPEILLECWKEVEILWNKAVGLGRMGKALITEGGNGTWTIHFQEPFLWISVSFALHAHSCLSTVPPLFTTAKEPYLPSPDWATHPSVRTSLVSSAFPRLYANKWRIKLSQCLVCPSTLRFIRGKGGGKLFSDWSV